MPGKRSAGRIARASPRAAVLMGRGSIWEPRQHDDTGVEASSHKCHCAFELFASEPRRVVAGAAHKAVVFVLALVARCAVLPSTETLVRPVYDRRHVSAARDPGDRLRAAICWHT